MRTLLVFCGTEANRGCRMQSKKRYHSTSPIIRTEGRVRKGEMEEKYIQIVGSAILVGFLMNDMWITVFLILFWSWVINH